MENRLYSFREWCENCDWNDTYFNEHCTQCVIKIIKDSDSVITEQPEGFKEKEEEDDD